VRFKSFDQEIFMFAEFFQRLSINSFLNYNIIIFIWGGSAWACQCCQISGGFFVCESWPCSRVSAFINARGDSGKKDRAMFPEPFPVRVGGGSLALRRFLSSKTASDIFDIRSLHDHGHLLRAHESARSAIIGAGWVPMMISAPTKSAEAPMLILSPL
jgi:hypothetical protein